MMKVYTCTDHEGHWVGVASVIVAEDEETARKMLVKKLDEHGLKDDGDFTLREIDITKKQTIVLQDGDY